MNKSLVVQPCRIPGEIPHFKNEMGNNWSSQRQETVVFPLNNSTISTATHTTSQKHTNIYRSNFKNVKSMDKNGKEKVSSWWSKQAMQRSKQKNRPTSTGTTKAAGTNNHVYWHRESYLWKRAHNVPRTEAYVSQQNDNRPDVTRFFYQQDKPSSSRENKKEDAGTHISGQRKKLRRMLETRKLGNSAVVRLTWKPCAFCFSANAAVVHWAWFPIYLSIYPSIHGCMYVCMCVCAYACMYVYCLHYRTLKWNGMQQFFWHVGDFARLHGG